MKISHPLNVAIDVDGVLLNWIDSFDSWFQASGLATAMESRIPPEDERVNGYELGERYNLKPSQIATAIRVFNSTINAEFLPPIPDAVKYVRALVDRGFTFHPVTAFSSDYASHVLRKRNLENIFGPGAFSGFTFLPLRASKEDHLKQFKKGTVWIDDHADHALTGLECGLSSVLFDRAQLFKPRHDELIQKGVTPILSWKGVFSFLTGE